jgi:hypothetical protein
VNQGEGNQGERESEDKTSASMFALALTLALVQILPRCGQCTGSRNALNPQPNVFEVL